MRNIFISIIVFIAMLVCFIPFLFIQFVYWIFTGETEKYTNKVSCYLFEKWDELNGKESD